MTKDVDEDLIEATIRRVRESGATGGGEAPTPDAHPAEDAIEATIRRVQAQAAAPAASDFAGTESEDQPQGSYTPAEQSRIEDTIRRVRTQAASHAEDFAAVSAQPPATADEDPIEATIRRVQEQAARAAADQSDEDSEVADDPIEATIRRVQAQAAHTDSTVDGGDEDPIEATIRRVQAQAAQAPEAVEHTDETGVGVPSLAQADDPVEAAIRVAEADPGASDVESSIDAQGGAHGDERPEPTTWPGRDERLLGEATTWEVAALRLEQGLQDARREVREMAERIEALERALAGERFEAPTVPLSVVPASKPATEEEWDDRPQVSNLQFGTPPRAPVYRDPSPQTATAAEFVEVPTAPVIERPAARLRAIDSDGNLDDRIPRQYRITVEDKRRGVDLVPLHRAMQGMDNVKDMSLLSYSNGVAMVLIESVGPLDPEILRLAVGRVMSRETLVEVHNEQTMVVKIQEE